MKIVNLVENTPGSCGCGTEHGLCFYIETEKHKVLMDTGASGLLLENAEKLGIDLAQVDTVVLSHGHYDHGGGILPFAGENPQAKIYIPEGAQEPFYSVYEKDGELKKRYIGLPEEVFQLPQVVRVEGGAKIDEELQLFSGIGRVKPSPSGNRSLKIQTEAGLKHDDFRHEQCLVVRQGGCAVLFSGCAHHGILNIMERYRELYGSDPDAVVSGFHFMKKDEHYTREEIREMIRTAEGLKAYQSKFYTCHCTGVKPYDIMKEIMGGQLAYVHAGDEVKLKAKGGKGFMRKHRFFAWATVFCFLATIWTGYGKQ